MDLTGDCIVNLEDFAMMASGWLTTYDLADLADMSSQLMDDWSSSFVTTWDTRLADGKTVTLAMAGTVAATIDWGDGTVQPVTTPGPHVHTYDSDGIHTVLDIGGWDTSSVTDMYKMFLNALLFNQDLSGWCVEEILSKPTDFDIPAPPIGQSRSPTGESAARRDARKGSDTFMLTHSFFALAAYPIAEQIKEAIDGLEDYLKTYK